MVVCDATFRKPRKTFGGLSATGEIAYEKHLEPEGTAAAFQDATSDAQAIIDQLNKDDVRKQTACALRAAPSQAGHAETIANKSVALVEANPPPSVRPTPVRTQCAAFDSDA